MTFWSSESCPLFRANGGSTVHVCDMTYVHIRLLCVIIIVVDCLINVSCTWYTLSWKLTFSQEPTHYCNEGSLIITPCKQCRCTEFKSAPNVKTMVVKHKNFHHSDSVYVPTGKTIRNPLSSQ